MLYANNIIEGNVRKLFRANSQYKQPNNEKCINILRNVEMLAAF